MRERKKREWSVCGITDDEVNTPPDGTIPFMLHILIVLLMVVIVGTFLGFVTTLVTNGDERITGCVVIAASIIIPILYIFSNKFEDKQ